MCQCPSCGAKLNIGAPKNKSRRWRTQSTAMRWTGKGAEDLERQPPPSTATQSDFDQYTETPFRAPDPISDVVVPGLMSGVVAGLATIDATVLVLNWNFWSIPPNPILFVGTVAVVAANFAWAHYTGLLRPTLWRIEELLHVDLNQDNSVGEPEQKEQESYAPPLKTSGRIKKATIARAPNINERHITIKPEDGEQKKVTAALGDLLHFASISFATSDWSRDAWANEMLPYRPKKMGQRLWADYKAFFESYDWWRTTDFTVFAQMDAVLRQTVTNER